MPIARPAARSPVLIAGPARQVRDPVSGRYSKEREGVEFAKYLGLEGWHIIPIKAADQLVRNADWFDRRADQAIDWGQN